MTKLGISTESLLVFGPEVAEALRRNKPVVALESTIITHGMPWPDNYQTAQDVENIVRQAGAVSATIAILDHKIHIGLGQDALKQLAQAKNVRKLSRADLAHALLTGETGSTTVAATMICAQLANIDVFATGGIGGVHHDFQDNLDMSADLYEFLHSNLIVVSAGVKAILDIAKTLEVLETLGVPVIAYGVDMFPAFWSRSSDLKAPLRLNHAQEIAELFKIRQTIDQTQGMLVANPVPKHHEIPNQTLKPLINQAQMEAAEKKIAGKAITPFLLQRIVELTKNKSLKANIALIKNNAQLAAEIALAIKANTN